jgi:hypothetical protein
LKQFKCYICSRTYAISTVCFHVDKDGKEFGVRTKEITITPAKPKENGYQVYRKPVEVTEDTYIKIPECKS